NARCPPDGPELGHASWTFLHSVAAYYPDTPTPDDQASMRSFVRGLGRWYPCGYCAEHVRKVVDKDPPRVESRKDLAKWFCDLHNEVNVRLGKPIFDCAKVDERWRDGPKDGSC
ncbi:sulfhydryl oxidase, partial [Gonapodya prolifera JEL478]